MILALHKTASKLDTKNPILVTGTAGFIGFHLAQRLLREGYQVVGIDMVNDYYDVNLKEARLKVLEAYEGYTFYRFNLMDKEQLFEVFDKHQFDYAVNLAAQAGVRHSLTHPQDYVDYNITGFLNILEACRHKGIKHLVYASSSSVYGANTNFPFSESRGVDHPVSLYAASKKANEMMAHSYAQNYGVCSTGLRFFSVYGPWGRPDMALFIFAKRMLAGETIDVYNNGEMLRDFTYIDDIVEGVYRLLQQPAEPDANWDSNNPNPSRSTWPFRIYNIGNSSPVKLMDFVHAIEKELGIKADINFMPLQTGDVPQSISDVSALEEAVGYKPSTSVETGIKNFISWFRDYYKL
ncbi:UDP-glucuronate 4-epimerase [Marinoscillum furvescens DSM 4134]|uniref:UDP-glucuronate 4-epimerase n=1 Tax=Marinoscillum furvescens DSM 4134 TaxID=1122208 RepID=A0A3D9L7S3_MARFU|nr:UDP-glucuronate 4-epimerase [Marinoscillum furvescens DSM 4134]